MRALQRILAVAVVAAVAVMVSQMALMWFLRPLEPFPGPVSQWFDSWGDAWILPPLPTAEYQVNVKYERKEGGRLGEPPRIKLLDETVGKTVPIEGGPMFEQNETLVGECHLSEGHQYRIEVDADQVKELGRHHHRLEIWLSFDELQRRSRWP
ncbi:MAG: hypothetical protein ACREHD_24500 [Pirellulales bacterium]